MSASSSSIQNLARQLLAAEPGRVESIHASLPAALQAFERLRAPLTRLAGAAGFSSLLSRALALARRQAPALLGIRVEADGSLAGFDDLRREPAIADEVEGGAALLAELLGLLVLFIGLPLTLNLVREAWPEVSPKAMIFSNEEEP